MKLTLAILLLSVFASAQNYNYGYDNYRIYKDVYGHSYKNQNTLNKDSDGDGVINRYDYNDQDSRIQNKWQAETIKRQRTFGY
jgi:hypothetical protein